jgi:hypothetical protein
MAEDFAFNVYCYMQYFDSGSGFTETGGGGGDVLLNGAVG